MQKMEIEELTITCKDLNRLNKKMEKELTNSN